jgi:hypothetical protein
MKSLTAFVYVAFFLLEGEKYNRNLNGYQIYTVDYFKPFVFGKPSLYLHGNHSVHVTTGTFSYTAYWATLCW